MTTAQEREAQGEVRGEVRGRAATLLELLADKFGPLDSAIEQRVHAADIDQLKMWSRRVLRAKTLEKPWPEHSDPSPRRSS